jgi:hypothetical protein
VISALPYVQRCHSCRGGRTVERRGEGHTRAQCEEEKRGEKLVMHANTPLWLTRKELRASSAVALIAWKRRGLNLSLPLSFLAVPLTLAHTSLSPSLC